MKNYRKDGQSIVHARIHQRFKAKWLSSNINHCMVTRTGIHTRNSGSLDDFRALCCFQTHSTAVFGMQMLQQGCDVNCCDYDGRTGLMLAASKGNPTTVKILLMAGASINASDNMGGSALLEACKGGHDETIQ